MKVPRIALMMIFFAHCNYLSFLDSGADADEEATLSAIVLGTAVATQAADALTIFGLEPAEGPVGTQVRLHGQNFGSTVDDNAVSFNGAQLIADRAATTALYITIPNGASSGPISVTAAQKTALSANFTVTGSAFTPGLDTFTASCMDFSYTFCINYFNTFLTNVTSICNSFSSVTETTLCPVDSMNASCRAIVGGHKTVTLYYQGYPQANSTNACATLGGNYSSQYQSW